MTCIVKPGNGRKVQLAFRHAGAYDLVPTMRQDEVLHTYYMCINHPGIARSATERFEFMVVE